MVTAQGHAPNTARRLLSCSSDAARMGMMTIVVVQGGHRVGSWSTAATRQAFGILRRAGGSGGAGGSRERTRSPSAYRLLDSGRQEQPLDGDRGRSSKRGVRGSPRVRDPPRKEEAEWERRRSRSPASRGDKDGAGDLGSALLSGNLQVAEGAPSPPMLRLDPMMEFYKEFCGDDIDGAVTSRTFLDWDPMLGRSPRCAARWWRGHYPSPRLPS